MSRYFASRPSTWLAAFAFITMALPVAAVAPPTITTFSPAFVYEGQYGTKFPVTINGTNFNWVSTVSIGGRSASFIVNSSTKITAYVPSSASSNPIYVTTPGGTAYGSTPFYVMPIPQPTIASFSPTSAYVGQTGVVVTIMGTGFMGKPNTIPASGVKSVSIGGLAATSVKVFSDTKLTAVVPAGATTYGISVTTAGGTGYSADFFTILPIPAPTITSLDPVRIYTGEWGKIVTITGTKFLGIGALSKVKTGVTAVTIGGLPASFSVYSATSIRAVVPVGATTNVISVTTSGGTAYSSAYFTVDQIPIPTIVSFTPDWAYVGDTNQQITITGSNFKVYSATGSLLTSTTALTIGGVTLVNGVGYNVIDDKHISLYVPAGAVTGGIAVTNAGGTGYSNDYFTIKPILAPTISSFTPESGGVPTNITITGTNFDVSANGSELTTNPVVVVGGQVAILVSHTATSIVVTVSASAVTGGVSVTTEGGTAYSNGYFTVVTVPAPTISSLSTTYGSVGDWIHIYGTHFDEPPVYVRFNGITATEGTVVNAGDISVRIPAGATTGKVTVTTPGGVATSVGDYTISATPSITGLSAISGTVGDTITISGTGFLSAYSVAFGSGSAFFEVLSDMLISATVPADATTGPITVTTPYGTALSDTFTVNIPGAAPTITSFTPASGYIPEFSDGVGASVTITGTGFTGATSVKFNGVSQLTYTVVNDTTITTRVPAGATTGQISVTTPTGTCYSANDFYIIPAPTVTSYTTHAPIGGLVVIQGTNFTDGMEVWFGSKDASSIIVWSSEYITVTVPSTVAPGSMLLTLRTPGGHLHKAFTVD